MSDPFHNLSEVDTPTSQIVERPTITELFRAHAPYIVRVLRRLGVSESDVEDLCQEVFVTAHRRLDDFEGRSSARTWLYGIAVRTAANHRRRAYLKYEHGTPKERAVRAPQDEALDSRRLLGLLDEILEGLEDRKREVFVLYEIEQLSMPQVAEALGCPLQTAYSRHRAAKAEVQKRAKRLSEQRSWK